MATSSATDKITKIANGIAAVLDATTLFNSGTTYETRYWQSGLPGYMIWWEGFEAIGGSAQPSLGLVSANMETRLRFNVTLAVRLDSDEQAAQEFMRLLTAKTVDALWKDKTLNGSALRSAASAGQITVRLDKENKEVNLTLTVLAEFAGSW